MRGETVFAMFNDFSGGVNWRQDPKMLPDNQFRDGLNLTQDILGRSHKRPGRTKSNVVAISPIVDSMYYYKGASNERLLYTYGTNLHDDVAASNIATVAGPCSYETMYGYCFFADGTSMQKYLAGGAVTKWGITPPALAPTETHASGSTLTAVVGYVYKYTYYNSATGFESKASSPSANTGAFSGKDITVSWTPSGDGQVTHVRIYRTDDGGDVYYRVNTIAIGTTSLVDTMSNNLLRTKVQYDFDSHAVPPNSSRIVKHKNRMFAIGSSAYPSRLYWSDLENPEAFGVTSYEDLDAGSGFDVINACSFGDVLLTFKTNKIFASYNMENADPTTFRHEVVVETLGLAAAESLTVGSDGYVYWLANDKHYYRMTSNYSPQRVSVPVDNKFETTDSGNLASAVVRQVGKNKLWLCIPIVNNTSSNDFVLEYDMTYGTWCPYMQFGLGAIAVDSNMLVKTADYAGFIWQENYGLLDASVPISFSLKTRYSMCGKPEFEKKAWTIFSSCNLDSVGDILTVTVRTETGYTSAHTLTPSTISMWIGGWLGGWLSNKTVSLRNLNLAQGMKDYYIAVDFTSDSMSGSCLPLGAVVKCSVEGANK